MSDQRIPVVLAIDVEPDDPEFAPGSRQPWRGFEACVGLVDQLRDLLAHATRADVRLTWFLRMDPQISHGYGAPDWVASNYATQLADLRGVGDELGLHTHSWRWNPDRAWWSVELTDQAWLEHCFASSFDAYRTAFGEQCRAHRTGDRFMSDWVAATLRARNVLVDLTPEPGLRGVPTRPGRPHTEAIPDMAAVPRRPYFASSADWRRPTRDAPVIATDLLTVPLASADLGPLLGGWRAAARRVRNVGRPLYRPLLPWAAGLGPRIWDILARDISAGELTCLAFAVRSHMGVDDVARATLLESMAALAHHPLVPTLEFVTASRAREMIVARPDSLARAS